MSTRRFLVCACIAFGLWLVAPASRAAILYTEPAVLAVDPSETFTLDVRLNSEQDVVNAVQARLLFDPAALEVVEVSKAGSFLVLWPEEPKVDASRGVITFIGGTPNGSYVVNGRLVTVVFRSKLLGSSKVLFDTNASSVHRNDGLGTKVSLTTKPAVVDVALTGRVLAITSPSHPHPDTWYSNSFLRFTWTTATDAIYAYLLSSEATALPDTRFGASVAEAIYTNVDDGVYTFIVQEKLPHDTWGAAVRRRVLVDTHPPQPFTPQLTRDVVPGKLALVFATQDATSGVARYRVQEGDVITDSAQSPYVLRDQAQQQHIVVTAYDAAGNAVEASIPATKTPASRRAFPAALFAVGAFLVLVTGAVIIIRRRQHT